MFWQINMIELSLNINKTLTGVNQGWRLPPVFIKGLYRNSTLASRKIKFYANKHFPDHV